MFAVVKPAKSQKIFSYSKNQEKNYLIRFLNLHFDVLNSFGNVHKSFFSHFSLGDEKIQIVDF